jgi:hypothetical protein
LIVAILICFEFTFQVRPLYIREAYRLLQQSIIFVESEDIELDGEEDDDEVPEDAIGDNADILDSTINSAIEGVVSGRASDSVGMDGGSLKRSISEGIALALFYPYCANNYFYDDVNYSRWNLHRTTVPECHGH